MTEPFKNKENCQASPLNTNFEEIFSQSPIGIFLYDNDGRLTNANDSALNIARIPKLDDVLGTNIFENPTLASKKEELHEKGLIKFQDTLNLIEIKEQNIYNPFEPEIFDIDWTISVTDSGYLVQVQDITEQNEARINYEGLFKNKVMGLAHCKVIFNDNNEPVDFKFIDVNDTYEKYTGLKREEVIGKTITKAIPGIDQSLIDVQNNVALNGEDLRYEFYEPNLERWYEINVYSPQYGEFISIFTDISQKKETEERYNEFFNNPIVGLGLCRVVVNEEGKPIDYIYLNVNDAFEEFTGLKREEIINMGVREVLPEDANSLIGVFGPVGLTGGRIKVEVPIPTLGRIYEVDAYSPSKNHFIALFTDITERKKAEEALKEITGRFRVAILNSPINISAQDLNLEYTWIYNAQLGYSPDDVVGKDDYDLLPPKTAKHVIELKKRAIDTNSKVTNEVSIEIEGNTLYYDFVIVPLYDSQNKIIGVTNIVIDITERKNSEIKLYESEYIYHQLFNSMTEMFQIIELIYDNNGNAVDYYYRDVNPAFETLVDKTRSQLVDKRVKDIFGVVEDYWLEKYDMVAKTGTPDQFENYGAELDKWYDVNVWKVTDNQVGVTFSDITERKKAEKINQKLLENEQQLTEELQTSNEELQSTTEELYVSNEELRNQGDDLLQINNALKKSEERFRTLADNIPNLAWMADATGWIFWYNTQWFDYTGTTLEEMQGWGWQKVHHPDYVESITGEWASNIRAGKPFDNIFPLKGKNGNYRWFLTRITPIRDEQGKLLRWFGTNTDITELKQSEEELKRSNIELERFAYVSSHDLQEPLRMVTLYSQLLERRYKDNLDNDANDFIEYIVEGANRMRQLIDDLLEYSRVTSQAKEFEKVDLEKVLDVVLHNLAIPIQENNVTISHDTLPIVFADKNQMVQVFQNLINNAIKFHGQKPPEIHISAQKGVNEWKFALQDNGIGIEPKHQKQIFKVFKRLHNRDEYPGTGIGLSIVQKIILHHSGRIWVESELGKGSSFYFTIPNK